MGLKLDEKMYGREPNIAIKSKIYLYNCGIVCFHLFTK
jgi:hypothetical protein